MSDPEIVKMLTTLNEATAREESVEATVRKVNDVIKQLNKVVLWVQSQMTEGGRTLKSEKDFSFNHVVEYILLYFICGLTLMSALDFIDISGVNMQGVITIAIALSGVLLVGVLKQMLSNVARRREKETEILKKENEALKAALSSQSLEVTVLNTKVSKLIALIRLKDPTYNIDYLFAHDVMVIPSQINQIEKQKPKEEKKEGSTTICVDK